VTAYEYFRRAESVEATSAEIYERLAEQFAGDTGAAAVFRELAEEERQHAARVRLMGRRHAASRRLFDGVPRLEAELAEMEELARRALDELASGAWGHELAGIHARLAALEERITTHAERMARGADPSLRGFFEALAAQDRVHRRMFADR
jgi:rubrerythrin